ncbi:MAG: thiamine pyrophosphate-binding protein [Bacteroidia bacterium]|nr:thiamine pyrophosphate-binding protein [Bacteroidia bacterium]GIV23290.1 MAG: acetolactate synthase I/II/III large subunit [Bacteroidia bacterium]
MSTTGGRLLARLLRDAGMTHLFTLSGGHIMEIYEGCADIGVPVIDFRHEQAAGFAAEAAARLTRKIGVCAVTAGPGVMNVVTAVANAWRSQTPMIVIGGQAAQPTLGMGALQEMDHVAVLAPITKWAVRVPSPKDIPDYVQRAFNAATSGVMGPVFLECPMDILFDRAEEPSFDIEANISPLTVSEEHIQAAVAFLSQAERPVLLLGSQILFSPHATRIREIIEALSIPVYTNGMARGTLGADHPLLFLHSRKLALAQADVVILAGVPLDFRLNYGTSIAENAALIRIDRDLKELQRNRIGQVSAYGDPGDLLYKVSQRFSPPSHAWATWKETLLAEEQRREAQIAAEAAHSTRPVNPLRLCIEVNKQLSPESIVIGDGGDIVGSAAYTVRPRGLGRWLDAGPLGTLGAGAPYAIAAKLLYPESDVWVIFGDGAFGLNGMEYDTAVRFNLPFVGVIGNDAAWTQIKRAQIPFYGRAIATELLPTRYDKMVEALGGWGAYVEDTADLPAALAAARASGKPAVVNVRIGETEFRKGSISM